MDILMWRDLRLTNFMDFALVLKEMGEAKEFVEFDLKMKNSAQVNNPTNLMIEELVKAFVKRKLGIVDLAEDVEMQEAELLMKLQRVPR